MRLASVVAVFCLVLAAGSAACPASWAANAETPAEAKIDSWLLDRLRSKDTDSFLVLFDRSEGLRATLREARRGGTRGKDVYDALRTRARSAQAGLRAWLDAKAIPYRRFYIVNGLALRGSLELARAIAARDEVARVVGDPSVLGVEPLEPVPLSVCGLPYGVQTVHADQVWTQDGAHGEGIVIASADTGVQFSHPALLSKYRGWNGVSSSHDYNWHDAILDVAEPFDDRGHGTHTVGTMTGDDGGAERIGVAPGARWIACRNMNQGVGSPSTYLECNQFFLAPYPHGGDPETDGDPSMAPDVINNSWGCPPSEGCDPLVLEDSFAALEAAGILAVASAGNSGPSCSTVTDPPAIYRETFVVGATNATNTLASFSSRGPVTADGSNRLRPDVVAPGVSTCSSVPTDSYAFLSGTSMAGPHVAGATALLWSAKPQLKNRIGLTRCVLSRSSNFAVTLPSPQTCGDTPETARPNNLFGWGLVDAYAAVHLGPDADADGIPDGCDCAPSDAGAFDVPPGLDHLEFSDSTTIGWEPVAAEAGSGTVYDLVRGALADLAPDGIGAASCLPAGTTSNTYLETAVPAPGDGYYYVVRSRNACGTGGWGAGPAGTPRTHADCP